VTERDDVVLWNAQHGGSHWSVWQESSCAAKKMWREAAEVRRDWMMRSKELGWSWKDITN
jgi:hypothetical protein